MTAKRSILAGVVLAAAGLTLIAFSAASVQAADNPSRPAATVKLVFIHHSCGENWLTDGNGDLGIALRDNNYFVSDTNYGWGPDSIGDKTDIGNLWTWFCGPKSAKYLAALHKESNRSGEFYSRLEKDPGGENSIVMFKSCYPNSYLGGNPSDPPVQGKNPLRGQDCGSEYHAVGNAKGIYNDLLAYFKTRQDKLFILVTSPPQSKNETDAEHAACARALTDWLVNDWLKDYPHKNVAVYNFYNVLTSNSGSVNKNDAGKEAGNHHRFWNGQVQHQKTVNSNFSAYPSAPDDSHPTAAGNKKATEEFVKWLNVMVNRWRES
jgi:hypothetical protein